MDIIIPMKICKICQTEKPKSKFSGRSARCCLCMYNKNKDFFKKYYTDNTEHLVAYSKNRYHTAHDGIVKQQRGRQKNEPILPKEIKIPT